MPARGGAITRASCGKRSSRGRPHGCPLSLSHAIPQPSNCQGEGQLAARRKAQSDKGLGLAWGSGPRKAGTARPQVAADMDQRRINKPITVIPRSHRSSVPVA
ncbi:MAG: hypothetical protein Kow0097_14390 [Candidatus Bipolaricaulota bacterium]